jgi:heme oxygenase
MTPSSGNAPAAILQRLKSSTADVHERVERQLQIFAPEFDMPAYVSLLARFYGFWAPVEAELRKVAGLHDPELAFESRLKSHLLQADLRWFGFDPVLAPLCSALPAVQTFASGLGCLYVLEGSTLGSKFIAGHIAAKFGVGFGSGASFFNAYGPAVGERWSEFRRFVTSRTEVEHEDEVLRAARTTFETLHDWIAANSDAH